jgi:hypothetical protein
MHKEKCFLSLYQSVINIFVQINLFTYYRFKHIKGDIIFFPQFQLFYYNN